MMLHITYLVMSPYPIEALEAWLRSTLATCNDDTKTIPSMRDVVQDIEEIWRLVPYFDSIVLSEA